MKTNRNRYLLLIILSLILISLMIVSVNAAELVSVDSNGVQANGASHEYASLDQSGNIIAFASSASNLVDNDANGVSDIFVRDRQTGVVQRVSVGTGSVEANGASYDPSISYDGRYVVFTSDADNLVANDTNGVSDVFLYDRVADTTVRVSVDDNGNQANGASYEPVISGDGSRIAFTSEASNLVSDDTNGVSDVFICDVAAGTIKIVKNLYNEIGDGASSQPSINENGKYVAFTSKATNFEIFGATGFDGITSNVFSYNFENEHTSLISGDFNSREAGNGSSYEPSISSNGNYIAFTSEATNFAGITDTNNASDVFISDYVTVYMVSVLENGVQGNGASRQPAISGDGLSVAFTSAASNFTSNDNNAADDIYLKNLIDGSIILVSANISGSAGSQASTSPAINYDGSVIAFTSSASDLAANDANGVDDVFAQVPYKADMTIKAGTDASYIGQGIYNNDGTDQTRSQNGIRKKPIMYLFRVYNRGISDDSFIITGTGSSDGWDVKYYIFGTTKDVTNNVTGAGWRPPNLAPGGTTGVYAM